MCELVNVVGGGEFRTQLPLEQIYHKIEAETKNYEPEQFAGLVMTYSKAGPTLTLFSSGNYHIAGAKYVDEMKIVFNEFAEQLEEKNFISSSSNAQPEVRNRVYVEEIGHELELEAFLPHLGFENTEYSPDQFPGLFYQTEAGGTIILFRSGKFVLTGISDKLLSIETIKKFKKEILDLVDT